MTDSAVVLEETMSSRVGLLSHVLTDTQDG
jgi:hypothetical protein